VNSVVNTEALVNSVVKIQALMNSVVNTEALVNSVVKIQALMNSVVNTEALVNFLQCILHKFISVMIIYRPSFNMCKASAYCCMVHGRSLQGTLILYMQD